MFWKAKRLRDFKGEGFFGKVLNPDVYRKFNSEDLCELMFLFLLSHGRGTIGSDRGFLSSKKLEELTNQTELILAGSPVIRSSITKHKDGKPMEAVFTVKKDGCEVDVRIVADLEDVPPPRDEVADLYKTFMEKAGPSLRTRTWTLLAEKIESAETSVVALLPVIFFDRDTSIVASVTLEYARMREPEWEDELTGVRELLHVFESSHCHNRAAVFLGLLTLGDRRVTDLLRVCRSKLDRFEVKEVCAASCAFTHAPVVEFLLDWLKDLGGDRDDGQFGSIANRLLRYATEIPQNGSVIEQKILFPSKLNRKNSVLLGQWTMPEFAKNILPSLIDIAKFETGPPVLPIVISAWKNLATTS